MTRVPLRPPPPQALIRDLLAAERDFVPEEDGLRERAIERAKASLPPNSRLWRRAYWTSPGRRVSVGIAAAAGVVFFALCAAAFQVAVRYHHRSAAPSGGDVSLAAPVEPPAPQPEPLSGLDLPSPERAVTAWRPRVKPAKRATTDSEAYAIELPVLRPALDAVARHDFSAALVAIAAHQRKFPTGQLAEEREGLRVKALVGLGHMAEATRAAAAFRECFPQSALAAQVHDIVGSGR